MIGTTREDLHDRLSRSIQKYKLSLDISKSTHRWITNFDASNHSRLRNMRDTINKQKRRREIQTRVLIKTAVSTKYTGRKVKKKKKHSKCIHTSNIWVLNASTQHTAFVTASQAQTKSLMKDVRSNELCLCGTQLMSRCPHSRNNDTF